MFDYLDYLPPHLRDFKEYIALGETTGGQISLVQDGVVQIYRNRFIEEADLSTIMRWEKLFNIQSTSASLELRRQQVIAYFNMRAPITGKRLQTIIENITLCKCDINVKHDEFRFEIIIINSDVFINFPLIFTQVHKLKPANMLFDVIVETQVKAAVKVATEKYKYPYKLTGNDKVGTLPDIAYIGLNKDLELDLNTEEKAFSFKYEMTGTKPYTNVGGVLEPLNINLEPNGYGYTFKYDNVGTEPYENTEGALIQGDYAPEIEAESFKIVYRKCGTSNTRG
ncbi:hypothetical protein Q428_08650 [Fervidicella metallireducens AeB]|uniref:DUF2313 domain-containing protein n=1 Tax=Fervidicella metallireducens AeB TaxID=1403537 RepID=A0A017RV04_9CLOT|nr:putative phage tail protein [Fervidicella metallireducens]EYE88259.1 hypothetical protein Q428_08650 [Fervidicella metallireducens AeB]